MYQSEFYVINDKIICNTSEEYVKAGIKASVSKKILFFLFRTVDKEMLLVYIFC